MAKFYLAALKKFSFNFLLFIGLFLATSNKLNAQTANLPVYNTDPTIPQIGWDYGNVTANSGNYDCGGDYVLRFNGTNSEYALVNYNSVATNVSFIITKNSNKSKKLLVQESVNGTIWTTRKTIEETDLAAINTQYTLTYLLNNNSRYVRFIMTEREINGGNFSLDAISVYNTTAPSCVSCQPYFNNQDYEYITNVNFGGINNTTGATAAGYANYVGLVSCGNVSLGVASQLKVTINADFNDYVYAWIDWNQDGDFTDLNEQYVIANSVNTNGPHTINITPPAGASLGSTRMRVMVDYANNKPDPCRYANFGEAEDYCINVIGACSQPTSATAQTATIPAASSITICQGTEVTLKPVGGLVGVNQSWKWYSGSCGGTTAGSVDASDGSIKVSPTTTTTYYVRIEGGTCSTNGNCASVTVTVNKPGTISHTSGNQNITSACKGVAIPPVVYTIGGGANSASISWSSPLNAPAGITASFSANKFTLGGTPGAAVTPGTYNYTITATGSNSPCSNADISGSITITDKPTISYSDGPYIYCKDAGITPNIPVINTGGLTTTFSTAALPVGLTLNSTTGVISGTPTALSVASNYIITATNSCGSSNAVISISVNTGNVLFSISPSIPKSICSTSTGEIIGLSGSVSGINYQLWRDNAILVGSLTGTGGPLNFGTFNTAGTYTVVATTGCATNMNGSFVLNVTPQPTTQFSYQYSSYCKTSSNPTPTITTGSLVPGGTFGLVSGSGLVFTNSATGEINLASSDPGTYNIVYNVPASGGCDIYTSASKTVTIINALDVYDVLANGSNEYCEGTSGVSIKISPLSQDGIQYQLYRDGLILPGVVIMGNGTSSINFPNQTIPGNSAIFTVQAIGTCSQWMNGSVEVIKNPAAASFSLSPATATICQGSILPITAAAAPPNITTETAFQTSGSINQGIPNNNGSGISNLLKLSGVAANATINWITVKFYIDHNTVGDLRINLKGPNGNVLNIINRRGSSGNDFGTGLVTTPTSVSSNGTSNIALIGNGGSYNTINYLPEAQGSLQGATVLGANISNVSTFYDLFGANSFNANGNWILSISDLNGGDAGRLLGWSIHVNYSKVNNSTNVTWSSSLDLFTDAAATIAYTGGELDHIYVKPQTSGNNIPVMATLTNDYGCTNSATSLITVQQSPKIKVTADYCNTGGTAGTAKITATSDVPISNWTWNFASEGTSGNNSLSSYIEVKSAGNYYVSGFASGTGYSCPGTGVMSISQELVNNGNFELGNVGFNSGYHYQPDVGGNNELVNDMSFGRTNGYGVGEDGQFYHNNFWGVDHTTANGSGKFMIVNGHDDLIVWEHQQSITVIPGVTYYFSGYGLGLNSSNIKARLQFQIDDGTNVSLVGNVGIVPVGVNNNSNSNWEKFWGQWTAPAGVTQITLRIINKEQSLPGNDFGLDDVSFGTLSVFFKVVSSPTDLAPNVTGICEGTPIKDIVMEYGGNGAPPVLVSGTLPPGVLARDQGRVFTITGTPAAGAGGASSQTYSFTYRLQTPCGTKEVTQTIKVFAASKSGTIAGEPLIAACYNDNGSLPLSGSLGTLTWQSSTDSVTWTNVPNGNYGPLTSEKFFRVSAKNNVCAASEPSVVKVAVKSLWTGKINTTWNNKYNWSDRVIPTQTILPCPTTIIPVVSSNRYPELTANEVGQVYNLDIHSGGANVKLYNDATLKVANQIISANAATITAINATIELNGPADQTFSGRPFVGNNIKNLLISGTKITVLNTAADSINILNTLSFENKATAKLETGNNITLKSSDQVTASVGELKTGNIITGTIGIERYLKNYRVWRFLATPVKSSPGLTFLSTWGENGNNTTGYGTRITGPAGNFTAPNVSPGYSTKWYNSLTGNYEFVTNPNNTIANKEGYMIFVRGDLSATPANTISTVTNLRIKGAINTGDQLYTVNAGKYLSFGNPYPSAISAKQLIAAGGTQLNNNYIAWDPSLRGTYNVGGFQTITEITGQHRPIPGGTALYSVLESYPNIQSGQAVFLFNSSASNLSFTVKESMKVSTGGTGALSRTNTVIDREFIWTTLFTSSNIMADGNLVAFDDEFTNEIDRDDAKKITNSGENFGLIRFGTKLAVEARERILSTDTIFYNMTNIKVAAYKLAIKPENIQNPAAKTAFLIDKFLNTETPIDLAADTTWINFSGTSVAASRAADRFMLVFKAAAGPLPVTLTGISANRNTDRSIAIRWTVENEVNIEKYEIERSADGRNFAGIISADATNINVYTKNDLSPLAADNFYRIKAITVGGYTQYSAIVKVAPLLELASITVYPNPVVAGRTQVRFINQTSGTYELKLFNQSGQLMQKENVKVTGNSFVKTFVLNNNFAGGVYQLTILNPDGTSTVQQLIIK